MSAEVEVQEQADAEPTAAQLEAARRATAAQVRQAAKNFYYAFRLLPGRKRAALLAVYGFCRQADDIADGQGSPEQRRRQLEQFRAELGETLAGHPRGRLWLVLWEAARVFDLSSQQLNEVIDGCAADCAPLEIVSQADLDRYCYGVAGTVGMLSASIFGYRDPRVPQLAVRLGEAMQLTNILRDLREDAENGRCYLPREQLERFGLQPADLASGPRGPRAAQYRELMRFQVGQARQAFSEGEQLVRLVDRDSRGCPAALAALYRALLKRIEARDYDVQSERIALPSATKLRLALGAWVRATLS